MACNKNYNQHEVADCLTLSYVRLIVIDYKKNLLFILVFIMGLFSSLSILTLQKK